jgi:hypothetical protein
MATKRKTRKFTEGGMSEEDVKSFAGTPDNDSNAGMADTTVETTTTSTKAPSFKEAFAAARGAGDKTFEWGGKKFTTEMAKPKAAAAAEAPAKPKYQSLQDRAKSYEDARAKSGVGMYGTKKSEPKEERKPLPLKSTKSETGNKFMGSTGLKSGGSVKGWGQARGARKAKMY